MPLTSMDVLSICIYSLSGFVGILANATLLVAIKCRAPPSWKSYTILLVNSALIDLVACCAAVMSMERAIVFKDVKGTVFLGPCSWVSGFFCHVLHSITMHSVAESLFLTVISLGYRLYILGNTPPRKWRMIIFCISVYLPSFVILFASFFINNPSSEVREALKRLYPEHDQFEDYVFEGRVDSKPRRLVKFVQAYMLLPVFPLCIISFIVRHKVIGKIKDKSDSMSDRTREMHKSLVKILTLHASLPILFLLMVISYIVMIKRVSNSSFFEYSMFWYISFMPSLAPLVTLSPFRKFVLGREKKRSAPSAPSTTQK